MTVRIDPVMKEKLDRLSRATARTKSFIIHDAIREYIEVNEWQIEAINEGIRQADAGLVTPHHEVKKKWEERCADSMD